MLKDMRAIRRFDGAIYVTMITRGNPETGQCLVKHAGRVKTVLVKDLCKI